MMESRKAVWTNKMLAVAGAAAVVAACSPPQPVWGEQINPPDNVIHTSSVGMGTLEPGDSLVNQGASWARIRLLQALPAYGCKMAARL